MKVLGKIIVTILALLFTGSTFFILIGSTQMNSNDVLPVIGINTLITIICIWLYIKFNKKNELNQGNNSSENETSLSKAIYNHGKDIVSEIKPTIEEYKQNHSTSKIDSSSFTIDEINSHTDRVKIDGLDYNYFSKLKETKFNYLTEDEIYEKVMLEIEEDKKIKSTWGKALSQSDGNKDKAEAIYIKERVLFFKNQQKTHVNNQLGNDKKVQKSSFEIAKEEYLNNYNKNKNKTESEMKLEIFLEKEKLIIINKISDTEIITKNPSNPLHLKLKYINSDWYIDEIITN